jgi:superfamily II DNA or RNA helicase
MLSAFVLRVDKTNIHISDERNTMLTLNGYKIMKSEANVHAEQLRKTLTVKPYIPSVFVANTNAIPRYKVYREVEDAFYVPKHFGMESFGVPKETTRDVQQTNATFWEFNGSIRDAQQAVVASFLTPEPHDGILSLHTGGGKTVCALYIAAQLRLPTLVIVHNSFLRDQWIDRVKSFLPNARIGRIQGDVCEVDGYDVVIAMLQTLSMKEIPISKFKPLGLVIVDECHHIASEVFVQALPKVTSKYMLGLSATPTRKDGLMFVAHWFLGPLLYQSQQTDIRDNTIQVEVYEYQNEDPVFNEILYNKQGVMFTTLMINKLTEEKQRTSWLAEILQDVVEESPDRQILVLTDRVQHTKDILQALPADLQEKAAILSTGVHASKRSEYCSSRSILIATYAMCKEGFDVPTLNTLMMATPRPDIDQIVGRILRVEKSARTIHPLILDIVDPQFRRQFQERNGLYKKRAYTVTKMKLSKPPRPTAPESV